MRLKELRDERALTQTDVARGVNTNQQNISRWEKGEVLPTSDFIVKLADFFGVSADYLLGRSDDFGNVAVFSSSPALSDEELQLVEMYRSLSPDMKKAARDVFIAWTAETVHKSTKRKS